MKEMEDRPQPKKSEEDRTAPILSSVPAVGEVYTPGILRTGEDEFSCQICLTIHPGQNWEQHIQSAHHRRQVELIVRPLQVSTSKSSTGVTLASPTTTFLSPGPASSFTPTTAEERARDNTTELFALAAQLAGTGLPTSVLPMEVGTSGNEEMQESGTLPGDILLTKPLASTKQAPIATKEVMKIVQGVEDATLKARSTCAVEGSKSSDETGKMPAVLKTLLGKDTVALAGRYVLTNDDIGKLAYWSTTNAKSLTRERIESIVTTIECIRWKAADFLKDFLHSSVTDVCLVGARGRVMQQCTVRPPFLKTHHFNSLSSWIWEAEPSIRQEEVCMKKTCSPKHHLRRKMTWKTLKECSVRGRRSNMKTRSPSAHSWPSNVKCRPSERALRRTASPKVIYETCWKQTITNVGDQQGPFQLRQSYQPVSSSRYTERRCQADLSNPEITSRGSSC